MALYHRFLLFFLLCLSVASARAYHPGTLSADSLCPVNLSWRMAANATHINPAERGMLGLQMDGVAFFKDNEYAGNQVNGYSLPGFWMQPRLTYQPTKAVKLELGFHALVFSGANKYPCYVYHDIGRWKGNQYQSGAHLLPFFRASAVLGKTTFVLGNIYGGANHRLMEPLINPEVNLNQDPEMGVQVLYSSHHYRMDAWLNWQSYIFEEDTHQEAFTVGISQRVVLSRPNASLRWYIPVDIIVQHRGGEQDLPELGLGVQTLCNGGAGLGLEWLYGGRILRRLGGEVAALGCWQQSGDLWPFNFGGGFSAAVSAWLAGNVCLSGGVVGAKDFVSLYGIPFFSTVPVREKGAKLNSVFTPHGSVEWSHDFGRGYLLGAKASLYLPREGQLTHADGTVTPASGSGSFSFGIYFRFSPRFRLAGGR